MSDYSRKSVLLNAEAISPIVKKLQKVLSFKLTEQIPPRMLPPALLRSLVFDLSYLLIRHRPWHQAELLSELAIDFLQSEYFIPSEAATQTVEAALDVLHSYTPKELSWSEADYEREFLEHLILTSLISRDEDELACDLGFGRNVLSLIKNALELESGPGVFHFAPEITQKLSEIMQTIFDLIEESKTNMDLFRLKNFLQRDESTPKDKLTLPYLGRLNRILAACWPDGKTEKELQALEEDESFSSHLRLLLRNGLIYEEPRGRRQSSLFRLSSKGYELTCLQFAFSHWKDLGHELHLDKLPSIYQSTVLQILAKESQTRLESLLEAEGKHLSPVALRFVIEHMKQEGHEQGLLEIFSNLLHNRAHAWIRVEVCRALPLSNGETLPGELLDSLLNEDPSPMVRSAARASLQRSRRWMKSAQPQAESKEGG